MSSYLRRARSVLHGLFYGRRDGGVPDPRPPVRDVPGLTPPIPVGGNIAIGSGGACFVDVAEAAADPASWLEVLRVALDHAVPISRDAQDLIRARVAAGAPDLLLTPERAARLLEVLRPRTGLAARLGELHPTGVLGALLPESPFADRGAASSANDGPPARALRAIETLERLRTETSLISERFGSMLAEVNHPEAIVLTILAHDASRSGDAEAAASVAERAVSLVHLDEEGRRKVGFLISHRLAMSLLAFRQDTSDPGVIGPFAGLFSTEDQLKMLCVLTLADLGSSSASALTPWKAEQLWRLFVDAYNHMTMSYGDEIIDIHEAAGATLEANRPHDISEDELGGFLAGLPRRYLTLFDPHDIYEHARLSRHLGDADVHFRINRKQDVWEVTVVTLDKPHLFSHLCGVLACLGFDILRGYAFTSRGSVVVDVFQFTDHKGCRVRPQLNPLLADVMAGRTDLGARLRGVRRAPVASAPARTAPVIFFDNDASSRYTILEFVAEDAPGLLYDVSRVISRRGCVVDLVLIATEGRKAIDVFHLRKDDAKLTETEELALTEDFERMLDGEPYTMTPSPSS